MVPRRVALFVGTGTGYALGSLIAYWWFDALGIGPSFFPSAGLTMAVLVSTPRRDWPYALAGAGVAELTIDSAQGLGLALTLGYVVANVTEPLVGAMLIRSRVDRVDMGRRADLLTFLVFGVVIAPMAGAAIAATGHELFGTGGWIRFASHWWIGDGLGILVVAGSILAWRSPAPPVGRRGTIEIAAFVAGIFAATVVTARLGSLIAAYIVVVLLGWAAFRVGTRGVALCGCVLSFTAATTAAQGFDVYTGLGYPPGLALVYLQTTILLLVGISLLLAAEITERDLVMLARTREEAGRLAAEERAAREHQVALTLQHSFLGPNGVETPHISVAAYYRAGVEGLEAGGDWHDVIKLPDGSIGVAVGDVLGRGLDAAAAMGQIRVAMAALAPSHRSPAGLIDELERFTTGVDGASMATVAYAIIEPTTGRTRFAAAGHPPPLLIDPNGRASYLWQGRSRPIGATIAGRRSDSTLQAEAGSTLVLYTDGLVERRGEVIDRGLDRLLVAAEEAARGGAYDIRDHIADELLSGPGDDDVAMLVIRLFDGAPCYRRLLRGRGPSSRLRDEMGTWLQAHGVDAGTRDDIVLASWEAIANAMEHGSLGDAEGRGEVTMTVRDGTVETEVVDRGTWRGEPSAPPRGKGLVLMRGLVDDVRVEPGDSGTRVVLRRTFDRTAPAVEVPTHG